MKHGALKIFVVNPNSEAIANELTGVRATVCVHKRNPCILRCGVKSRLRFISHGESRSVGDAVFTEPDIYELVGRWEAIPNEQRRQSMERIVDLAAKDGICDKFTVGDSKRLNGWDVKEP